MDNGEWKMENGEWKMENGEWRMENGKWRMLPPVFARHEAIQTDKMDNG